MDVIGGELGRNIRYRFVPESVDDPDTVFGELVITPELELAEIDTPDFVTIVDDDWSDCEISLRLETGEKMSGNLHLSIIGDEYFVPILSASGLFAVIKAEQGLPEIADQTIKDQYDSTRYAWEFRQDCRDTLRFGTFIEVMDSLAGHSDQFDRIMYRSATGYFANRILDPGPQNIKSFEVLKDRIDAWNEKERFPPVSVDDIIAEYLGRGWIHGYLSSERDKLKSIGVDPIDDFQPGSIGLAGWIAHILLTEGEYAAKEFIQELPIPVEKSYSELESDAFDHDEDRWKGWEPVIPVTARRKEEEFHHDVYQYLRFAGLDYRGNAKISPLLHAGAAVLTGPLPFYFQQRVKFQEQISLGHEYRHDVNWDAAKTAFQRAELIATGQAAQKYSFDAPKAAEAKASLAHAEANLLAKDGNKKAVEQKYDSAIEELQGIRDRYGISVSRDISFLQEQREELLST